VVATVISVAALSAASASATVVPTLLANSKCSPNGCASLLGVYKVRPHKVFLAEAYGGNLVRSWTAWSSSAATGSGTATSSGMGTTTTDPINVRASRVRHGTFTRLTVTFTPASGPQTTETLHLNAANAGWTT
jgi:hypothetical protein